MTLTKSDIIENISNGTGLTKNKSTETVQAILEIIKGTLESGGDVLISGFGKFCVKDKNERTGRNPVTGDHLMLEARRVVTFKCSGKLRERINGERGASSQEARPQK
ncbi:integration host factor subunit alpha [Thermodesulfobacteriota bacterium]